jgi:hypothetical protein
MPSSSFKQWLNSRANELDEIEQTHQKIGGTGRGRRYATQQINRAYATLLSAQFQGFCRDLHSECVDHILDKIRPVGFRNLLREQFIRDRKIDKGNPNAGNLAADFKRFGFDFWQKAQAEHRLNQRRLKLLEELNEWRNAIAHQDFTRAALRGKTTLHLKDVRHWRKAINSLACSFDNVMRTRLQALLGIPPW